MLASSLYSALFICNIQICKIRIKVARGGFIHNSESSICAAWKSTWPGRRETRFVEAC